MNMEKQRARRADGRLQQAVTVGKDENGNRKRVSVYAATQAELDEKIAALKANVAAGAYQSKRITFGELAEQWLAQRKEVLSESTHTGYASYFRKHLLPKLGSIEATAIAQEMLAEVFTAMQAEGFSSTVMKSVKLCAAGVMDLAIERHLIERNPFRAVSVPSCPEKAIRVLTEAERQRILKHSSGHKMCAAALLMLLCGLRRAEALALHWEGIDFTRREVRLSHQLVFEANQPVLKPLDGAAVRTVPMPELLCRLLRGEWREGALCCQPDGGPYRESAFHAAWESYERFLYRDVPKPPRVRTPTVKYEKPRTLYPAMLRQTYAELLFRSGVDLMTAQDWLGQGSLEITCKLYMQVVRPDKAEAKNKLENMIEIAF